jgi:hypothetical protein
MRPAGRTIAMHGISMFVMVGLLLALAGCVSVLDKCRRAHPTDPAAVQACWNAVLQRQSAEQDRQDRLNYKGRQ